MSQAYHCSRIILCNCSDYWYCWYPKWRENYGRRSYNNIFLHEACHQVILKAETKAGEALATYVNGNLKSKVGGKGKKCGPKCYNCKRLGHKSTDCYSPGGRKEGQGLCQNNQKGRKLEISTISTNVTSHSEMMKEGRTMFAFSTTSSFHCITAKLGIPAEHHSTILNSDVSGHHCPDKSKFKNFTPIPNIINQAASHDFLPRCHIHHQNSFSVHLKPWPCSCKGTKMPDFILIHHAKLLAHIQWKILTYTDGNHTQQANHHSILGCCLIFRARAISWSLKKQNIITLLSTEAKYIRH